MLRNLGRAQDRLRRIGPMLAESAAEAALSAAERARLDAAGRAPVKTGRLRASLAVRRIEGGAAVTADCPYAAAVELGTSKTPPQPFLAPAADARRRDFPDEASRLARECLKD